MDKADIFENNYGTVLLYWYLSQLNRSQKVFNKQKIIKVKIGQ